MDRNCIIAIILCVTFFFLGRCTHKEVDAVETITRDTIRVFSPSQVSTHTTIRTIKVPQLVFAPNDTIIRERVIVDSIEMDVPFERREYRDSTLYAVVSGVSIGGIRPTLEYYETYNTTITRIEQKKPPMLSPYASILMGYNALGVGGGIFIKDKHGLGVDYLNINGNSTVLARYSFKF